MQAKVQMFTFVLVLVVYLVRFVASKEDASGNIYIRTPREVWKAIKVKYGSLVTTFKNIRNR